MTAFSRFNEKRQLRVRATALNGNFSSTDYGSIGLCCLVAAEALSLIRRGLVSARDLDIWSDTRHRTGWIY
jgi:hypothetical protein